MTPEEAIRKAENPALPISELREVVKILIRAYKTKKNFSKIPQVLLQKSVDKFFRDVDSNGTGNNWSLIQIEKIREFFLKNFRGIYKIPTFPFISDDMKKIRDKIK